MGPKEIGVVLGNGLAGSASPAIGDGAYNMAKAGRGEALEVVWGEGVLACVGWIIEVDCGSVTAVLTTVPGLLS